MKFPWKKMLIFSLLLLTVPAVTHADLINPLGTTSLQGFIGRLIKVLLGLSGSAALLMFVWGGFQYLWSAGDPDKVKKGKSTLINAALGLFIIFFAYTIVAAIVKALSTGSVA